MIQRLLAHPLTRGLDLDAPGTTAIRIQIIREKVFLNRIYQEWYHWISQTLSDAPPGPILELGSGGGFLHTVFPNLIASDIFHIPHIAAVLNAQHLPFADSSLSGIVMTNVLHHIPQPRNYFAEAARCVKPQGKIAMIEPWQTRWSSWVYTHLHHEPFDPNVRDWEIPEIGPLSGANGAVPWMIFQRDRELFTTEFPQWQILETTPYMPFRYLVSGGVSLRSLTPGWTFGFFRWLENMLSPWRDQLGMFAKIVLRRRP